jgi:glycosyltransferase involved in cell wall biosynthesis
MRICITRSEHHSYSETFIRDQIAGFSKIQGVEVFTVHSGRLPEREEDGTLLSPFGFWVLHKIVKGITGQRNNYFGNYGLKKFFRENKIDVVLANYGLAAAHLVPICKDVNIPLLAIFHGHDATDKKLLKEYVPKYRKLFAVAASVIVVSQEMRARIIQMGAPQEKISVVPCGVDPSKFKPGEAAKEKLFLAVGRFVAKKGPLLTIQAFHEVWKKHADATLVMVGGSKGLYAKCVELVNSLGMEKAVLFPGVLSQDQIRAYMARAMAFVQHSVTAPNGDMEGTPVSILEASASGLPVVSTLHGGIKDAILHGKTGFLVEEGDVQGMANYMIQVLENPERSAAMGKEGRLHIEENYSQEKQIDKLHALASRALRN